jgi:adenylosuccinate lyase
LADKAKMFKELAVTARSHNVPAQLTTLGKRMANWGEELEHTMESLSRLCATYPYRGIKGAVGTRLDQVTLLGSAKGLNNLIRKLCIIWGPLQIGRMWGRFIRVAWILK